MRDGLFLSLFPVQSLPYFMAGAAVLAIVASHLSGRLLARLGPVRVAPALVASNAALFLVEWFLLVAGIVSKRALPKHVFDVQREPGWPASAHRLRHRHDNRAAGVGSALRRTRVRAVASEQSLQLLDIPWMSAAHSYATSS